MMNMLRILSVLFFIGNLAVANSQTAIQTDSFSFQLFDNQGKLDVKWLNAQNRFPETRQVAVSLYKVTLEDADLVIWYKPLLNSAVEIPVLNATVQRPDGKKQQPGYDAWLDLPASDEKPLSQFRRKAFADITEQLIPGPTYTLFISSTYKVNIDCALPRPSFGIRQQWPFWATGIVGAGLWLGGINQQKQAAKYYTDVYEQSWKDGANAQTGAAYWDQVKTYEKKAKVYTATGITLVAIDGIWALIKWKKIKKQQRIYDKYCRQPNSTLGMKPEFSLHSTTASTLPGIRMSLNF